MALTALGTVFERKTRCASLGRIFGRPLLFHQGFAVSNLSLFRIGNKIFVGVFVFSGFKGTANKNNGKNDTRT